MKWNCECCNTFWRWPESKIFRRAAQSLHLTQPTLSRQLKELEEELGKQLFHRGKRRITLTKEGMLLRKRAEEIIAMVDKTEAEFTSMQNTVGGDIYIGSGETQAIRRITTDCQSLTG